MKVVDLIKNIRFEKSPVAHKSIVVKVGNYWYILFSNQPKEQTMKWVIRSILHMEKYPKRMRPLYTKVISQAIQCSKYVDCKVA